MNNETQKFRRPPVTVIEVIVSLIIIYTLAIRLTILASLVALVLLYIFYPLYHNRRVLAVAGIVLVLAVLIPFDVYVRSFHGPIIRGEHSGLRVVRVVYGLGAHPRNGGEAVSGGCVVRPHDTRWVLVWD